MNDQTPQDPNPNPNPASAPSPAPTGPPRRTSRPVLIGLGAAAAVLLAGGAGAAIALSISGGDDDRDGLPRVSETVSPEQGDDRSGAGDVPDDADADGTDPASPDAVPTAASTVAPADAASLADAIDAAVAEAGAAGATSIEAERGGWDVDVVLDDRREVEVFVGLDGAATVRETGDGDDRDSDPLLDPSRIAAIVDAAIEAAGGGAVESISTDDGRVRYDVSVDLGGGRDVDVELAEDLDLIAVDGD